MPTDVIKDLEDVKPEEDFFEKILNEDIEIPTDDDNEDSATSENKSEEDTSSKETKVEDDSTESVEALKAKIAELEKERKGQLNDVIKSRQERSLFKSELTQLKDAVAMLLEKRQDSLTKEEEDVDPDPLSDTKAKVEFNEDDKAYVDLAEVKKAISTENAKTKQEIAELKEQRAMEEAKAAYDKNVQSIISEDERFGKAYENLQDVFKDLNDQIIELQKRTGELGNNGVLSADHALELFSGSPEEKEFFKQHPDVDPTRIVRAFNSRPDLRYSLRHIADVNKIGVKDDVAAGLDDKIKDAKNKPGSLANQGNRAGEETSDLIERIASISTTDFELLSDAEAARIESMLLREELQGD